MKRIIILMALVAVTATSYGQGRTCDCSVAFADMIEKLEANYIGLKHFQVQGKGAEYEQRKAHFAEKAISTSGVNCTEVIQEFLDFFEDGHLFVFERPEYTDDEKDAVKQKVKGDKLSYKRMIYLLEEQERVLNAKVQDKIVGKYSDSKSEFAIIKNEEFYDVRILKTQREGLEVGELKARITWTGDLYKGVYYTYSYAGMYAEANLYKENTLLKLGNSTWARIDSPYDREISMFDLGKGVTYPTVTKVDESNVLISIPSFIIEYQQLSEVIKANQATLLNAKNLIIDIRGNTGGNAIYFQLFNLFADKEMIGGQGDVLASEDNRAYFERNIQFSSKLYKPVVEAIEKNMGEIVDGPAYPNRTTKPHRRAKVQNLAILTDNACASAAESFIIHAKRSSTKVKTFGSPTFGMIDYTSVNTLKLKSGNQNIYFGYPTSTLHKEVPENGYNKTGIIPDVPIDKAVKDKVAFIIEYYRKN